MSTYADKFARRLLVIALSLTLLMVGAGFLIYSAKPAQASEGFVRPLGMSEIASEASGRYMMTSVYDVGDQETYFVFFDTHTGRSVIYYWEDNVAGSDKGDWLPLKTQLPQGTDPFRYQRGVVIEIGAQ